MYFDMIIWDQENDQIIVRQCEHGTYFIPLAQRMTERERKRKPSSHSYLLSRNVSSSFEERKRRSNQMELDANEFVALNRVTTRIA